ncbi:MAG TPA: hypothetical protein VKP60_01085, partial [Magnetospirillaceae bacterium]|nr:hypothetical protein [Magnetospirillaceae bacterium]
MDGLREQDLKNYVFQSDEALLLCGRADAEFVARTANATVRNATVIALSADAHGRALRVGFDNVVPPYELASYREFFAQDYDEYARIASAWFGELTLSLTIEGINLAELDDLYQYWFFQYATYMAGIADKVLRSFPHISRFFLPVGAIFLPAELFLDTDVGAAMIRHVAERLGRTVIPLVMENRPLHYAAWTDRRPFMDEAPLLFNPRGARDPALPNIGIVPAVIHRYDRFVAALNSFPANVTIFSSAWSKDGEASSEGIEAPPGDWLATLEQTLENYWQAFRQRREQSPLPAHIFANPHLDEQFAYIIKTRWANYARYIYQAANYVARNPLDLFIYCDHFTAEGAIFAHLYRRAGTKIAVAPHSPHFFAERYGAWKSSDIAIVSTGFAESEARRCGLSEIYHIGYGDRSEPAPVPAKRKKSAILFLANASEVQFPLIDMKACLETVSVLAAPPKHLAGKVEVTARLKPGVFAEDPLIFEKSCGLSEERIREQTAMTL